MDVIGFGPGMYPVSARAGYGSCLNGSRPREDGSDSPAERLEYSEVGRVGAVRASASFKEFGVCTSGYEHNQVLSFV